MAYSINPILGNPPPPTPHPPSVTGGMGKGDNWRSNAAGGGGGWGGAQASPPAEGSTLTALKNEQTE